MIFLLCSIGVLCQSLVSADLSDIAGRKLIYHYFQAIKKLIEVPCRGEPSIQNALDVALSSLRHLPRHTSREVLIVYAALTTCDPGEIETTIKVRDCMVILNMKSR